MKRAIPLMIQGTASDVGKSLLVTALCRIFAEKGITTAPFKSQNMSLNSYVTLDEKEIGRAQGIQAEAAGIAATVDMNPILIKPTRYNESQIIIRGEPLSKMDGQVYRTDYFHMGLNLIKESYENLTKIYEYIIIEGAGSPAEINLNDRELVNMRVARVTNSPVILVGDIDRGGVFASLVGTLQLLAEEEKHRVIGVIINKFRGDIDLLQPAIDWFELYTKLPVFGVVPYLEHFMIDAEDSLSISEYSNKCDASKEIDIAVLHYPRISNFTDIDPFLMEPDCSVRFVSRVEELAKPDLIVLPGSKNTIEDLQFLRGKGFEQQIKQLIMEKKSQIIGICGGYQMLGEKIFDPHHIESPQEMIEGIGIFPINTYLQAEKTVVRSKGILFWNDEGMIVEGYEIHMGQSFRSQDSPFLIKVDQRTEGSFDSQTGAIGTYFHEIFHNDEFRKKLLNGIRLKKCLPPIETRISYRKQREIDFDRLAAHIRAYVKVNDIEKAMINFAKKP